MKNCFFPERSRTRFSIWLQFFSFGSGNKLVGPYSSVHIWEGSLKWLESVEGMLSCLKPLENLLKLLNRWTEAIRTPSQTRNNIHEHKEQIPKWAILMGFSGFSWQYEPSYFWSAESVWRSEVGVAASSIAVSAWSWQAGVPPRLR